MDEILDTSRWHRSKETAPLTRAEFEVVRAEIARLRAEIERLIQEHGGKGRS